MTFQVRIFLKSMVMFIFLFPISNTIKDTEAQPFTICFLPCVLNDLCCGYLNSQALSSANWFDNFERGQRSAVNLLKRYHFASSMECRFNKSLHLVFLSLSSANNLSPFLLPWLQCYAHKKCSKHYRLWKPHTSLIAFLLLKGSIRNKRESQKLTNVRLLLYNEECVCSQLKTFSSIRGQRYARKHLRIKKQSLNPTSLSNVFISSSLNPPLVVARKSSGEIPCLLCVYLINGFIKVLLANCHIGE